MAIALIFAQALGGCEAILGTGSLRDRSPGDADGPGATVGDGSGSGGSSGAADDGNDSDVTEGDSSSRSDGGGGSASGGGGGSSSGSGTSSASSGASDSSSGDVTYGDGPIDQSAPGGDASDLTSGLVAFYKFDETSGTSTADSSGNGHTAMLAGGATFGAGLQNNAVILSGNGQYVSLPTGIVSSLSSFSITAWVKLSSSTQWTHVFNFGSDTMTYMFFTPNSGSTSRFGITTGGANAEEQINANSLPAGTWEHVAVTLSGGIGTLYVQGVQVGQSTTLTLSPSSLGTTTDNWLGRSEYSADPYLNGQLDNVRIYSRPLTAAEVQALYAGQL